MTDRQPDGSEQDVRQPGAHLPPRPTIAWGRARDQRLRFSAALGSHPDWDGFVREAFWLWLSHWCVLGRSRLGHTHRRGLRDPASTVPRAQRCRSDARPPRLRRSPPRHRHRRRRPPRRPLPRSHWRNCRLRRSRRFPRYRRSPRRPRHPRLRRARGWLVSLARVGQFRREAWSWDCGVQIVSVWCWHGCPFHMAEPRSPGSKTVPGLSESLSL